MTFDGDLTLGVVGAMAEKVRATLREADQVLVLLDGVDDIDLSVLQLLCSAHRSAAAMGKVLVLDGAISRTLALKVVEAGFHRHMGCSFVNGHHCIWTDSLTQ